jgi:uncharacterized protein YndB with AHSA1/START domain
MLPTILIIALAVVVILLIVVALQPAEFRVSRSTTISAPPAAVFGLINDFHQWDHWSPWAKLDPNATNSFAGSPEGEGAIFSWAGNKKVGEGRMTIMESRPFQLIRIKLEFLKPFTCTNTAEFQFKPHASGTEVNWSMYGRNGFMGKLFGLFMNMDKMVGADFEKGLASIKSQAEASKQKH